MIKIGKFYNVFLPIMVYGKKLDHWLKKYYKTTISLAIAILLPWILTLIFIFSLHLTHGLTYELANDPLLLFRITLFYTLNLSYELPIIGFGYFLCMIVWATVGFFIGLYTRKMGKSLFIAMIGIATTYFLYLPLVYLGGKSFPDDMRINPLIFTRTYENFSSETPIFLLYHISFHSFALPVLIMLTLIGSMLNSPREYVKPTTIVSHKKIRPKVIEEPVTVSAAKIKEKKKLRGFPGVIYTQFNPLNDNEIFKEKFKKTLLIFLLNPIDQLKAAFLIFDKGNIKVEEYKKLEPLMKMDKKSFGYNAMLQVTTKMFLDIATGKLSTMQLLIAERKDKNIKVKGKLKLLKLLKALKLLEKMKTKPEAIVEKSSELEPKIVPEQKIEKKKKLRGFAGVVHTQFNPLNNNEVFKEKFKKTSLKFLLNPIDQLKAALVIFDKGIVDVEEYIKVDPLMKMDKKSLGYDAMLQVTTEMLLNIAMGKMSVVQLLIAERKVKNIKVKGKLKLLKLLKALKILKKTE